MTPSPAQPRTILIGVCGGIAAYKTVEAVSRLRQQGHDVHVVMTEAAAQFVSPLTFAGVSGNRCLTQSFPDATREAGDALYPHLYPATRADAFVLMPATANTIGRIAQGLGHEIVSLCALSLPTACRRFFCPSMNVEMWAQDSVQHAVHTLEQRGWIRLGPDAGALACGMEGAGRLVEPEAVVARVEAALAQANQLTGKRILILSGPTREHLDPVRYLGNASSGRMGQALAEEAADRGATVTFITGPVHDTFLPRRAGINRQHVVSADDMLRATSSVFDEADGIIFAAAVADYRPVESTDTKQEKAKGEWALRLTSTPDIAATLSGRKSKRQRTIGFALQSGEGHEEARRKLVEKHFDGIVLNHPDAMDSENGTFTWFAPGQSAENWGLLSKRTCAARVMDRLAQVLT